MEHLDNNTVVIVESPTKANTITRFLPKEWKVIATVGHLRDLPRTAKEVPAKYKEEKWARLGIDIENDFKPLYVVQSGKRKNITTLKNAIAKASTLILATDEDREGESISWHLIDMIKPKMNVKRMAFHEITKSAIEKALTQFRDIDMNLVRAQETRRMLDRLYGYTLSPLLWEKIAYRLSAGRVQSPSLHMIVTREVERINFEVNYYWDFLVKMGKEEKEPKEGEPAPFEARLQKVDGVRVVRSADFDSTTGKPLNKGEVLHLDEATLTALVEEHTDAEWRVSNISEREFTVNPAIPFITSSLQQDGTRKLRISAREVMRAAQQLYEKGFITYMRTDSPHLSGQSIAASRAAIEEHFGERYLFKSARQYKAKAKHSQESHEAIRPAGDRFIHPNDISVTGVEKKLYELIWKRTLATQMIQAKKKTLTIEIEGGRCRLSCSGTTIVEPGFLLLYPQQSDEQLIPPLAVGDRLYVYSWKPQEHKSNPPARYTEASLIRKLEDEGIGRPSTYAMIIATLLDRDYVNKTDNALIPTFTGMAVIQLLEKYFKTLIDYGFTSDMEQILDTIANGDRNYLEYLRSFYLGDAGLQELVSQKIGIIDADSSRTIDLPQIESNLTIKIGRFGPYVIWKDGDDEPVHATIPQDIAPADLTQETLQEIVRQSREGPQPIGNHPDTNTPIYYLTGRYGPYLQLGDVDDAQTAADADGASRAPKRASVPKGMKRDEISLEFALKLLSLPRTLGINPENEKEVIASTGRYGPYIKCDTKSRSIPKNGEYDVYTIDLAQALKLMATPTRSTRTTRKVLKDLGTHPKNKKPIQILDGRYGAYIKWGTKNIALPQELRAEEQIQSINLAKVLEIIKEKLDGE